MARGKPVGYLQRVVKGGIDRVSWKIKWPFQIPWAINLTFHVLKGFYTINFSYFGEELHPKDCVVRCPHHSPTSCSWCCEKETEVFV